MGGTSYSFKLSRHSPGLQIVDMTTGRANRDHFIRRRMDGIDWNLPIQTTCRFPRDRNCDSKQILVSAADEPCAFPAHAETRQKDLLRVDCIPLHNASSKPDDGLFIEGRG